MTVAAVIQARMSSSRLPGKVLEELGDSSVLAWVVDAARGARSVDRVVVATSLDPSDDALVTAAADLGVDVARGPLEDVLARFVVALDAYPADVVVRLTSDCPLLDPRVIDECVELLVSDPSMDMATNVLDRTYPRGLDVEVMRADALRACARTAVAHHRAHVTSWMMAHRTEFSVGGVMSDLAAADLRVTVDTPEDLAVVRAVVDALGARASRADELVAYLRSRPDIVALNAHVEQKPETSG